MSANEHDCSADERFERRLLDSARSDELPRDLDSAWQRFDTALRGVSVLAAGAAGARAARQAQRWLAAKWLFWGALAGSALTVLGQRALRAPRGETSTVLSPPAALTIASAAPSSSVLAPAVEAARSEASNTGTAAPPRVREARSQSQRAPAPAAPPVRPSPPSSTLAAQVALLDAARTAVSSGATAEALRLAERYRTEFPNGALSPEAEVVAIEALVARGAHADASERAGSFFARYPGDPHAARVKRLVR